VLISVLISDKVVKAVLCWSLYLFLIRLLRRCRGDLCTLLSRCVLSAFWTFLIIKYNLFSHSPTYRPPTRPTLRPTDWPTDQPTDWPTDQPSDRPTDWLTDRPTLRPTDRLTDRPTNPPTDRLTDRHPTTPSDRLDWPYRLN